MQHNLEKALEIGERHMNTLAAALDAADNELFQVGYKLVVTTLPDGRFAFDLSKLVPILSN